MEFSLQWHRYVLHVHRLEIQVWLLVQIEMSPPDVKASRRLLISAVREAVAESARLASTRSAMLKAESGSKHLPSAVSPDVGKFCS
jgi:hypothetical protein